MLKRYLGCAALLLGAGTASAHISYTNRDFGTLVPNAAPVTISNQTVTGNYGWADGTDDDNADSHKVRYYRFTLATPAYVTVSFSGSTNGGARDGTIKPGFSIYQGLAHVAPITTAPGSPDYDTSLISMAYRAQLETTLGHPVEGCFHALKNWRIGGENQPGPTFDFDAADGLSTFVFKGYAADGDSTLFGSTAGVIGDGNADGTITKSIYLQAGNYTVAVGGVNYAGQAPTPDATIYGLVGTISATAFSYTAGDPAAGGIGYQHQVVLDNRSTGSFSSHVGAWSWEDESQFDAGAGEPPVGWTHTSNWVAVTLQQECLVTVTMKRDNSVPWVSGLNPDPNQKADTSSMFPSFTLWRSWDNDDSDDHTYNNRGNVAWAEDLSYIHHVDNSTETEVTRTYYLPAGQYTMALGSNAPATNTLRQGYNITFTTGKTGAIDPVLAEGGVGYTRTTIVDAGDTGSFSAHVGAWSWEDNDLFDANAGEPPVGWTHTSQWAALKLNQEVLFTITMERDANVPWPSLAEPNRLADTSSMFPSFTLFRGWDNDGSDHHTYNNRGRVVWAEDLSYVDHVDNSTSPTISRTYRLPAGLYSLVMGSNAPATNTLRQGFKLSYSAVAVTSNVIAGDPQTGGIGYAYTLTAGAGETGTIKDHTGAWSWEDQGIAPGGGEGWTHTSKWVALNLKQPCTFSITMARDTTVPYSGTGNVGGFAAIDHMFPSMSIYRGWDNDLMPADVATQLSYPDPLTANDHHTYANRANIIWAEDLSYLDHIDNTTAETVTRSWTLPAGNYSLALGSNSPSDTSPPRQGFSFTFTTSAPQFVPPVITKQPKSLVLNAGSKAVFTVAATGPNVVYQWQKDGDDMDGETQPTLTVDPIVPGDAGAYRCIVRNAAAVINSDVASLTVISKPNVAGPLNLPDAMLGELINVQVTATNNPTAFKLTGRLPTGVTFNAKTGLLFGRPTTTGSFPVTIVASNAAGTGAAQSDTFVVNALTAGAAGSYTGAIARSASLNEFLGGCITLNTLPTGGLTGSVKLAKMTYPLMGSLSVPA
ncbi:MAG: immunoglobulin domain-containing protein, partial [Verrucomicrobiaceae bacterium]